MVRSNKWIMLFIFFTLMLYHSAAWAERTPQDTSIVYFSDDFENGLGNWVISGQDWGITSTDFLNGSHCITDSPSGNYSANTTAIISLAQSVDMSAATSPVLAFWEKIFLDPSSAGDKVNVDISLDDGATWSTLVMRSNQVGSDWRYVQLDLTAYRVSHVKIRFRLLSDGAGNFDGWYIDDVAIKENDQTLFTLPFSDDFENGTGKWIVSGRDWALTNTESHSTGNSVSDSPGGNYTNNASRLLIMSHPVDLTAAAYPKLTFWHKYLLDPSSGNDIASVDVSKNGGSSWFYDVARFTNVSSAWTRQEVDLSGYKSAQTKIRFRLASNATNTFDGWYIDDVDIRDYPGASPQPPGTVSAVPGNGRATIAWGSANFAISYNLYWSTVSGVNKTNGTKIENVTSPYLHTGRNNGMTYYYVVTAVNANGESDCSQQVSVKPDLTNIPPQPPSMITPTSGNKQALITWTAVSGATSYNLYWSTTPDITKATGTKITTVTSPFTHTGLENFTTYYYILASVNTYGEGAASSVFSITPKGPPPVPTQIKVSEGDGKATITCGNVNGATSYNVYWSTTPGVTKANGQKILKVTNPFIHENLANLMPYYYVITAVNSNYGESDASAQFLAVPKGSPYAPKFIRATDADNGQILITWDAVVNATTYNLYWSTTPGVTTVTGTKIANVSSPYTHAGLNNLTTYYYIVTAVNDFGEGHASLEASEIPTSMSTTIKFGQAVLGTISAPGQTNSYKFSGVAGDKVIVSMSAVSNGWNTYEPDAYVQVFASDGSKTCEAYKDLTGYYDAAAHAEVTCTLPSSGVYTIVASDRGGNSTGSYSLYIQRLNKAGNATTMDFGQTFSGTLATMAGMDTYTFFANADDKVIVSMSMVSNGLGSYEPDAYVRVFAPDGSKTCDVYKELSDYYDATAHAEVICNLPAGGVYTILASEFGGNSTGNYSLYIQRLNKAGNAPTMAFGQTLSGTLATFAGMDTYNFFASADDKITVSMTTETNGWGTYEPDAHVRIFTPDGSKTCEAFKNLNGYYDDTAKAEVTCSLPTSGLYTIIAGEYGGNSTGKYVITLSCLSGICGNTRTFDIIASAGSNGTISPSGMVTLADGSNQTFMIKPNLNSHIEDVKVDGVSVGAVESYTFNSLKANHTINATFGGTKQLVAITVTGTQTNMNVGATQNLSATARYSDSTMETLTNVSWQSLNTEIATVETLGDGTGKVTAIAAGSTSITASFGGIAGKMDITVGSSAAKQHYGNLILVAGGGIRATNTLRESTQYLADLVYGRFKSRLFTDNDIYYFNPKSWHDLDGDGYPDSIVDDSIPTVAKFGEAITKWAKEQNSDGPLYIYLIDHGGTDQFLVFPDDEILTANQLKGYLDTFQADTGRKVIVVIEACKSGSFTDNITQQGDTKDRIIITSTGAGDGFLYLQGRISFTQFFTDAIITGDSIYQAYLKSKSALTRIGSFFANAEPKIAETISGSAAGVCIGGCFLMAPLSPAFVEQSPNSTIAAGATPQMFHAKLSSLEGIESVWAVVRPPDFTEPPISADFQAPEIYLPMFSMTGPDAEEKFTGTHSPFNKNGDYQIVFYARNNKGIVGTSLLPTVITVFGAAEPGDVNGDGSINLTDAVIAFQMMSGKLADVNKNADVNSDGRIGLPEVIYILQKVAGVR